MDRRPSENSHLLEELEALRQRVSEMELAETDRNRAWDRVRESEEHYRAAVENVADAIVINVGTTRVFVNNAFLSLHGLDDMSQAAGLSLDHFIIPEDRPTVRSRTLARERGEPVPGVYEYRIRRTSGQVRTVESSAVAITFNGEPATLAVLRDISDRKDSEERVRRLAMIGRIISSSLNVEEVYEPFALQVHELIDFERIVITIAEPERDVFTTAYVSGGDVARRRRGDVAALASSLTEEVIRRRSGLLIQPRDIDDLRQQFTGPLPAFEAGYRSFLSVPLISRDEVIGVLHLESTSAEAYTERDVDLAESVGAQISGAIANARLFQQLERERERLRLLTMRVVSEEEEERHRVSRELHDEAGQALTALKISLGLVHSDMADNEGPLRDTIASAVNLTEETMEKIRLLARGLRPPELDAVGLNDTLEGYCREFAQRTHLDIAYTGEDSFDLPDAVTICLYRFLQEALTNVARHAGANTVTVELQGHKEMVSLSVADNGKGFVHHRGPRQPGKSTGIGLIGMQERFELLGGWIDIQSDPGHGAIVVGFVPVKSS